MSNVKKIDVIFENVDYITFDKSNIGQFIISDIKEDIYRAGCNAIIKTKSASLIAFEIKAKANVKHNAFGIETDNKQETTFERIANCHDITSIEIFYDNDEKDIIIVNWNEDSDQYINKNQKTYISKNGNLYCVISEDKPLNKIFNINKINGEDYNTTLNYLY